MNYWQDFVKPNFAGASIDDDDEYSEVGYSVPLNGVGDKREIGLEGGFLNMAKLAKTSSVFDLYGQADHK